MIYELFVGQHPFSGPNEMMYGRRVSQNEYIVNLSGLINSDNDRINIEK